MFTRNKEPRGHEIVFAVKVFVKFEFGQGEMEVK
jgi:hypothetical protein